MHTRSKTHTRTPLRAQRRIHQFCSSDKQDARGTSPDTNVKRSFSVARRPLQGRHLALSREGCCVAGARRRCALSARRAVLSELRSRGAAAGFAAPAAIPFSLLPAATCTCGVCMSLSGRAEGSLSLLTVRARRVCTCDKKPSTKSHMSTLYRCPAVGQCAERLGVRARLRSCQPTTKESLCLEPLRVGSFRFGGVIV